MEGSRSPQDAAAEIDRHIVSHGAYYPGWYVGIAADPRYRLFIGHKVREFDDAWIHIPCVDEAAARAVEAHFHLKGCDGGPGGGNGGTRFVYAYRKARHTVQ